VAGGDYLVRVVIEGVDRASSALKAVSQHVSRTSREVEQASRSFSNLASRLRRIGEIAGGVVAGLLGFNILNQVVDGVRESIDAFAEFEAASTRLAALTREMGQDVNALAQAYRVAASAAARDFAVSANEALQALEALVKAGLSGRDAVAALGAVVQMARLEAVDFATAGSNLVQVMAQFGVAGSEAERVVDALVNASRLGIGAASDFAQGLANCGATARAMGLGLEDAVTWLVILERRFGSAVEAGTHLNRFLLDLYEIAGKLGVPIRDAGGALRDTNEVIFEVIERARELGGDFEALQERLRGVDVRAVKALATFMQMTESFQDLRREIERSGSTWEAYRRWLETTQGRFAAISAEVDLMKRRIGEAASDIATYLGSVFLPAVEVVFASWRGIVAQAVGDLAGNLESAIEVQMKLGRVTEEEAARWIISYVEMGKVTEEEALQIAEHLGIMTQEIQDLMNRSIEAGTEIPGQFGRIAEASGQLAGEAGAAIGGLKLEIDGLTASIQGLSSSLDVFGKAVGLASNFYDVSLAIAEAMGYDLQLSREAEESKLRLAAVQQTLNYLMQSYGLIQQALQLYQLGAKEAGDLLLETFRELVNAAQDGIITQREFAEILGHLGINVENASESLHNILVNALKAAEQAVRGNVEGVDELIRKLRQLDGMEVSYTIRQILVKTEGESSRGGFQRPHGFQRGAWKVTRTTEAILHRGEMVLPRSVAEWFRRGGYASTKVINLNVNVNAGGVGDPRELAEIISGELRRRLSAVMS